MSKRRRTSSAASRGQEEDMSEVEPETSRKRKRIDPLEICQQLYDTIRNFKKEDGGLLCDAFIRAPKRRQEPGYYEVVANPIDLLKVQQKLRTDEYEDVDQLSSDIELIVTNAKAFYKRTSPEYRDATELWDLFNLTKNRLLDRDSTPGRSADEAGEPSKGKIILKVGKLARRAAAAAEARKGDDGDEASETSSIAPEDESNALEELFTAVMVAQDAEGRVLHTVFQLLPSKKRYPEYYEVIDNPIDLKTIATRIQRAQYSSLSDLERDLLLMTKNACTFNEPGSQIYKDAKALRKIITARKIEIEQGRSTSGKSSERIRNKRLRGSQCLSAVTSALKYEEEDEEEEAEEEPEEDVDEQEDEEGEEPMEEDEDEEGDDDDEGGADEDEESSPLWQLFESVRSYSCGSNQGEGTPKQQDEGSRSRGGTSPDTSHTSAGYLMSDPFRKLPSKRYYPDYYKEIKNPISLFQIRSKLKQGHYGTLSELAGDLNIMFENAKKYNRADSQLYKDAVKLQKVMQSKVQELLEYDQDSDSDEDEERSVKRRGPKGPRGRKPQDETLKKRFLQLYRILIDHMEEGRQPILMFMEKPSKKLYPDYYQVIGEPIDMLTIEANIKNDKYTSEDQLISDFKLMFNNCRQYNEEGSVIYEDANKLERLLMEQAQSSPSSDRRFVPRSAGPKVKKLQSVLYNKLRILFEAVKEHKDLKGRQLSVIFNKLPSKVEYPDYYEVIKRPIDLEKISQKLKNGGYDTLEDMVSDFVLMFDNACKYNEPDSQIYKDALMLQRVTLQTKLHLREDEGVPDVPAAVQEMLTSLFTATYNHQDEEGRCFSDSMAELPEHDDVDGKKVRALSLDLIKRRLDRNLYKRLDLFQEDMFACLDRARRLSRSDSQVFEDAIELQAYFIKQRDEMCRGGDLLHSPALRYSAQELAASLEALRQEKALRELPEEEGETRSSEDSFKEQVACATQGEEMSFNQQLYRVGDFVYLEPKERGMEPHIIHIERLWTNQDNQQMLFGNYFYRPNETYHLTTRKFLEKEVFKSDVRAAVPLQQVVGVCYVLSVRDYLKLRPEGIPDKDVYVCESRYASKARSFKKIKIWPYTLPDHIPLVPREEPLEPKRVMSVFRERVEKHKEEIAELEEGEKLPEREPPPNVEIFNPQAIDGNTYYEQYQLLQCDTISSVKTGDCVYVQTSPGCKCVAQVDSIWVNKDGEQFFKGPWFVPPSEIPHEPSRLFYKQELFLSSLEDSHSLNDILGRCAVLEHGEYISCRPTEVAEQDVYICESMYVEARRQDHKLGRDGLKKYQHSGDVIEDEIYFFRRLINPAKVGSEGAVKTETKFTHYERDSSPLISRDPEASLLMEDSMDGGPPSVGSGDTPTPSPSMPTPVSSKKKGTGKKLVTGYILYSSDVRKSISSKFPDSSFGEISRIVGNEWRNLPGHEKAIYEERAARMNEETSARLAQEACIPGENNNPDVVYECLWDGCDWQFEDLNDLIEHCVSEPGGHVQRHFISNPDTEFQCHWKGCIRQKKTVPPFPNLMRLARHTKEQHIQKGNGRALPMHERSKNFIPARKPISVAAKPTGAIQHPQQGQNNLVASSLALAAPASPVVSAAPVRQLEPMFVSVPPRPQRLLHSEAYIKYIEGLASETKHISNWDKHLKATPENTPVPDASRLPSQWLGNGVGNHGNIVNALWALRDFMIRDALGLTKSS